ncbi:hypothetical protein HYN43_021040 [Mucilaginibacter celer]|uniref:Uncharacterized protein n=1 Tax=Mucilaginibacter celer TaxID=2305508 RepID=A0A494VQ35_9SPHI|nr:hypothetical protein HYN43_021040 [Mucilaginibacter celer]
MFITNGFKKCYNHQLMQVKILCRTIIKFAEMKTSGKALSGSGFNLPASALNSLENSRFQRNFESSNNKKNLTS